MRAAIASLEEKGEPGQRQYRQDCADFQNPPDQQGVHAMSGIEAITKERDAIDQRAGMAFTRFQQREMQVSRVECETGERAGNQAVCSKNDRAGRVSKLIDLGIIDEMIANSVR